MQKPTRDNIRDAASSLAALWVGMDPVKDREGVRRLILSHSCAVRPVLCAHIMRYLELRGLYVAAERFESMLFDLAEVDVSPDDEDREAQARLAQFEQEREDG